MPSDYEYLATAGINAESGEKISTDQNTNTTPSAAPGTEPSHQTSPQAPAAASEVFELNGMKYPATTEFKITHGGKILNVPYSKLANVYRQAEHYNDKYSQLNKQQQEWQQKFADAEKWKAFHDKYSGLQTWSEQNPQEWQRLWDLFQNKDKHLLQPGQMPQDPTMAQQAGMNLDPLLNAFAEFKRATEEKMSKYDQYVQAMEKQEQERIQTEDMNYIKTQVWDLQKEFPEINLDEKDPDGITLWAKIMQWGLQNNFQDFDSTARVFLKDRISDAIATRARAEAMKGLKSDTKAGIVQRSNTPITQNSGQGASFQYQKGKSYGQLAEMAKDLLASQG